MDVTSPRNITEKQQFINDVIENLEIDIVDLLETPVRYTLLGGGKRLRPLICIFCAELAGGDFRASRDAFIALELVHNGTLVHDDIIDDDPTRRGNPTLHVKFGRKRAVLAGDALFSLGLKYAIKTGKTSIVNMLSETSMKIVQGVALQTFYRRQLAPESTYFNIIYLKSGSLFEAAAAIGSLSADADEKSLRFLSDFGRNFGIAYQIRDDILDVMKPDEDKTRSDALNGDLTLPFIYAFESDSIGDEEKGYLLGIFQGRTENVDYEKVRSIYKESGSFERSILKMKSYADRSRSYLDYFSASEPKECLIQLVEDYYGDLSRLLD